MAFPLDTLWPWLAGLAAVVALALTAGRAWLRATAARREARRRDAERSARRARAEAWWRQHSLSTLPHSRFFESVLEDPPGIFASTRPPSPR